VPGVSLFVPECYSDCEECNAEDQIPAVDAGDELRALLLCNARLHWKRGTGDEAGGAVTGPVLNLEALGELSFVVAILTGMFLPRVAAAVSCCGAVLSTPLFVYSLAPVPVAEMLNPGGEFKTYMPRGIYWWNWRVEGIILMLAAMGAFSIYVFNKSGRSG
jgi:hypothetical protein